MSKFYDDYAEIDEEDLPISKIKTISTYGDRLNQNCRFTEYRGLMLPKTIIKSIKIKSLASDAYKNFNVFFDAGEEFFMFKLDEMPKYFYSYNCKNIYADIKRDDCETYIIEIECLLGNTPYFSSITDDIIKLSKKGFQYILKDKVIIINFDDHHYGRYRILTIDEYLKIGKPLINTFVDKIKSSSKSANKR